MTKFAILTAIMT